jgi:pimeloyl-ACP methyl ester carboxylesterase
MAMYRASCPCLFNGTIKLVTATRLSVFVMLTLLAVVCTGSMSVAVRSPTALAATTVPRKAIVFIQGVCSELPETPSSPNVFDALKAELIQHWGYTGQDFLDFSYRGGSFDSQTHAWHPASYIPTDPVSSTPTDTERAYLHTGLLLPYHNLNPDNPVVVVGHSLGGVVAMDELVQYASQPTYPHGLLQSVITVDSPLGGFPGPAWETGINNLLAVPAKTTDPLNAGCVSSGPASQQMLDRYAAGTSWQDMLAAGAKGAHDNGIAVLNVGNDSDCLWRGLACGIPLPGD